MDHREELVESVRAALKEGEANHSAGRRSFLKSGIVTAAAAVLPLEFLSKGGVLPAAIAADASTYGPLIATPDSVTGNTYLKLPAGFSYMSFGAAGLRMDDGILTPGSHDGMGVCRVEDDRITLVRNHELWNSGSAFGGAGFAPTYDSRAMGGTTTLVFDALRERWEGSRASLAGTVANCAGGVTPWGTWLTCEEDTVKFGKNHGFVFEIPTNGSAATGQPLTAMGRFEHEAAAVVDKPGNAQHGWVYMTQDRGSDLSGFYRFRPREYGNLAAGGTLEMLKIVGRKAVVMKKETAKRWAVEWVTIPDPHKTGVHTRGKKKGGAVFAKLEGAWYSKAEHAVWFISSETGTKALGRIYKLNLAAQELHMVYDSPGSSTLEYPDNITVLSNGDVLMCEDPSSRNPRVHMMNAAGTTIFPLIEHLNGTSTEFTGACFHGKWLFVNSQTPGRTYAITGPWENGTL